MEYFANHWMISQDKHAYLTEIHGEQSIEWVKSRNSKCLNSLGQPNDNELFERVLSILDCKDKIPTVRKIGKFFYNFWQDANNKRGIWRRTKLEDFVNFDCKWETVLNLDEVCQLENESWVWKGHTLYEPDLVGIEPTLTLVSLSRGTRICIFGLHVCYCLLRRFRCHCFKRI